MSEIDVLIAQIQEAGWPDGLAAERAAMEAEAPPLAADIAVEPLTLAGRPAEILSAPGAMAGELVLYLHGGGYVYGSLSSHRGLVGEIARAAGQRVLQLEYRLAPEHPHPAALDDAVAAVRTLYDDGLGPDELVLVGDSAGGGLVLATLLTLKAIGHPLPRAAVCLSPWTDLTCKGESYDRRGDRDPMIDRTLALKLSRLYANGSAPDTPAVSPLFGDLTGLPPLLIQVGEREVLYSDSKDFTNRALRAGVDVTFEEWPDMIHVWHLYFPQLTQGRQAIDRIGRFIASTRDRSAQEDKRQ
ncbi:MAG: alpha/beta hydrolase [Rhodobacter sp.]|nr:alpha/beta hydrolase [Rhodobacter sp.]